MVFDKDYYTRKKRTEVALKEVLKRLHDNHPDLILMNLTSAINPSFVLKEAWKTAYPNEELPKFLSVDPRRFGSHTIRQKWDDWYHNYSEEYANQQTLKRISKGSNYAAVIARRIAKSLTGSEDITDKVKSKRVLIFDECSTSVTEGPHDYIKDFYEKGLLSGSPLVVAYPLVDLFGFNDIWVDGGVPGEYIHKKLPTFSDVSDRENQIFARSSILDTIAYRQLHGQKGKAIIKELKQIGKGVGDEVREELQNKRKSLERRVAVASILSFILSALFFGRLTGSVIGRINQNNSGLILLFISLFLGVYLIYLKRNSKPLKTM